MTGAGESTAFHEAGHLVADGLRGGAWLRPTALPAGSHADGMTWWCAEPEHRAFIIFGGPWAQARHGWGDRPLDDPAFDDELLAVLHDFPDDEGAYRHAGRAFPVTEHVWAEELAGVWPAVCELAQLLLRGAPVGCAQVQAAVAAALPSGVQPGR